MDMPEMGALAYPEFVHHEQLAAVPVARRSRRRRHPSALRLVDDTIT